MEYNTSQKQLVLPEYGRNVQKMVDHISTLSTREERSRAAQSIISIMGNLNPHLRDVNDFKHKLWDHLHIMSNFKLDIDSPYPKPSPESFQQKPNQVPYKENRIKYRHYGRLIEEIIEKAIELEDGEEKKALIELIMNHMKKSYLAWNKDSVSDEVIFSALETLSASKLQASDEIKLAKTKKLRSKPKTKRKRIQKKR